MEIDNLFKFLYFNIQYNPFNIVEILLSLISNTAK